MCAIWGSAAENFKTHKISQTHKTIFVIEETVGQFLAKSSIIVVQTRIRALKAFLVLLETVLACLWLLSGYDYPRDESNNTSGGIY